jgi:hypothetical protein
VADFIVSPRFDRPPPVGGWLKSALGGALWEAPLYAAILAGTLNCSYLPPSRAKLDVRVHTSPDPVTAASEIPRPPLSVIVATRSLASTSNATSYAMDAFKPVPHSTLVCFVFATGTVAAAPTMTGGGLTWTRLTPNQLYNAVDTAYAFWARAGPNPASCTPTFDCTGDGATGVNMMLWSVEGADPVTSIVQSKQAAATGANPTLTFAAAMKAVNAYVSGFACQTNPPNGTAPANWTRNVNIGYNTPTSGACGASRVNGESGTTVTWTQASSNYAIWAVEIAVAAPLVVPSDDTQRNASYRPAARVVLDPRIYPQEANDGWWLAALPTWDASLNVSINDTSRNVSYIPPDRTKLNVRDTRPQDAPLRKAAVALWEADGYQPISDETRNSWRSPERAKFLLGIHDTSPAFSWLTTPLNIGDAALAVAPDDAPRNSYRFPDGKRLDVRDTEPQPAWIFSSVPPSFAAELYASIGNAQRTASYRPSNLTVVGVGRTTSGSDGGSEPAPPWDPSLSVGAADETRNAYQPAGRPSLDVRSTAPAPAWIFTALTPPWDPSLNASIDDEPRNSYFVSARASLDVRDTAPAFSWLQAALSFWNAHLSVGVDDAQRNVAGTPIDHGRPGSRYDDVLQPAWIFSSLPSGFQAHLYAGIGAQSRNASYRPSNLTVVGVGRATPGSDGGTTEQPPPVWDPALGVGIDDLGRNAYVSASRAKLDVRSVSAPAFSWLQAPDVLFYDISVNDAAWNCYLPPVRARLALGRHDTAPQPAWIFSSLPVEIPTYPPGVDQIRNSYRVGSRAGLVLGVHDTAPSFSWLWALSLWEAPLNVPINDAPRNSYVVPASAKLDVRNTAPNAGWGVVLLPVTAYTPGLDAARNSYRSDGRGKLVFGTHDTAPEISWLQVADSLWNVPFGVGVNDETRNSYRSTGRPRLVPGIHDIAPLPVWFYSIPIIPPPTYPPDNDAVRNSYSPPRRARFSFGIHDLVPEPAWLTSNVPPLKIHVWVILGSRQTAFALPFRPSVHLSARLTTVFAKPQALTVSSTSRSTTVVLPPVGG